MRRFTLPRLFTGRSERPLLKGFLDDATLSRVRGWAVDESGHPPGLIVSVNGTALVQVQPSLHRPDLLDFARKDLGFDVQLDPSLTVGDIVGVTDNRGKHLVGSPKRIADADLHEGPRNVTAGNTLDAYLHTAPSDQNALDIFKGEWGSCFPAPFSATLNAGSMALFEDSRITWAIAELGGVSGFRILELGPLEGGHSYMLEQHGASSILAIEGNTKAYLKCLITKEILDLKTVRFLCGDFVQYLQATTERFDMILASGVLYHMTDPVKLISLIAQHTTRTYFWTHYWDGSIAANPNLRHKFPSSLEATTEGFRHMLHRQEYQTALNNPGFCGGSQDFSHWLSRADLLGCLARFGFHSVKVGHENPDHPNGPSLGLVCTKEPVPARQN